MIAALKSAYSASFTGPLSFWALLLVFLSACGGGNKKKDAGTGSASSEIRIAPPGYISKAETERLRMACQAWYDTVLRVKNFNGGIIVAKKGNIVFEAYNGTVHIPGSDPITDTTPLHIASVSKTFTAMAVLKLAQDGKLNIDDELAKYFPQFNYPGVTVRMLMNHRSGIPNYTHFLERMNWDKKVVATNQDVLNFLVNNKAMMENVGTPGTRFSYCNSNFALLALLIEKVSGKRYADYLSENFFKPLNMRHTYVFNMADTLKAAPSYDWKGRLMDFNFLDAVYGDKNIYTTPRDLLVWDRALTASNLFTPETLAQAYTAYSNEKPGNRNYGLGWRMYLFPTGKKIIYHNGWWHGSNASFTRLLQDSATIIVIGNKFNRGVYHARVLANLFGDYYLQQEEEEGETQKTALMDTINRASIINRPPDDAGQRFRDLNRKPRQ